MDRENATPSADFPWESLPKETCLRLLELYSRMMVSLDGFWYLACAEKTGTDVAVECDKWVWTRLSRYVTQGMAQALGLEGRRVIDYMKVLQARPTHLPFEEEVEVRGPDNALFTIRKCPTLLALEAEGQGRDSSHCRLACVPIREAHARYFNPAFEVICRKMPPRRGEGDIACQWEYVERASPR